MNVGITIHIKENKSLFVNGLDQNALMLYDVIKQIPFVENVFLVNTNKNSTEEELNNVTWTKDFNILKWDHETPNKIQLLITLGTQPAEPDIQRFKSINGNKVVGYKGGNSFILHMEELLHHNRTGNSEKVKNGVAHTNSYDEIWMVPQQEYHNKSFFEINNKTTAKSVPFVWSPKFINSDIGKIKNATPWFDDKVFETYRVVAMEPNSSVLKNMLPIIYSYEYAYRLKPELFKKFVVTNASSYLTNPMLLNVVSGLDIQKNKMLAFDARRTVVQLLSYFSEMIVSHQWGNPLNYAYLDVVYFGFPLIHNAHLCQDIGYYYEDFNLKNAGKLIVNAALERKDDTDYTKRHQKILKRYTVENRQMIEQYGLLIQNLFELNEINNLRYNWKTNLLE